MLCNVNAQCDVNIAMYGNGNKNVITEKKMLDYLEETGRSRIKSKKLLSCLYAEKILLYEPLLKWYLDHGAQITAVYRTIECKKQKIFGWFVDEVTEAGRSGDKEKSKALLVDIFKLLGNSGYGKLIEALERETNITYIRDEKVVDRAMRSCFFQDLEEVGETYEIERRKARINIKRPFQVGIAVYQLAKLRMLDFYYDFLDKYFSSEDFELIQMDTDSNYLAISAEKPEDIVKPEMKKDFEENKKQRLAWDKWSGRTPGLFKLESQGPRMIALCSKCYFIDADYAKFSTKGMSKKHNNIT